MKSIVFISLFLFPFGIRAQNTFFNQYNFSTSFVQGYISDNNNYYDPIVNDYLKGINISVSKYAKGNRRWHTYYNQPEIGTNLNIVDLSNPDKLGYLFTLNRYIDFNIFNINRFDLDFRSGLGGSFVTKKFHPTQNYQNTLFSKNLNFYFDFWLTSEYQLKPSSDLYLHAGLALLHASNGETSVPNGGVSAFTYLIGISYKPTEKPKSQPIDELNGYKKKFRFLISPSFGLKEDWRWGSQKYIQAGFAADVLYAINKKQLVGIGFNAFYDEAKKYYSNHNTEPVTTDKDASNYGFHLTHQFNLYPLFLVLNLGVVSVGYDGAEYFSYKQMGIRYNFLPHVYATMYHKSRKSFYGENILWGIGFDF